MTHAYATTVALKTTVDAMAVVFARPQGYHCMHTFARHVGDVRKHRKSLFRVVRRYAYDEETDVHWLQALVVLRSTLRVMERLHVEHTRATPGEAVAIAHRLTSEREMLHETSRHLSSRLYATRGKNFEME